MTKNYFAVITLFLSVFMAYSQSPSVDVYQQGTICSPGDCTDLKAIYTDIKETTSYTVSSLPYQALYSYGGGTQLDASSDDKWSPIVTLPFDFCFYGHTYNRMLVGSNGVITFDITNNHPEEMCPYEFNTTIPNIDFPIKNAIYGVYQDTNISSPPVIDPYTQNVNYYVGGTTPNRYFVINYNELPLYDGSPVDNLQTSQIVLYETTNAINIYIKQRTSIDSNYNNGNGVIGVQNQEGTQATIPPGRNTGNWTTVNEAWRFEPAGNSLTTFEWKKNGIFYSNEKITNVCQAEGDIYTATATYSICSGGQFIVNSSITLSVAPDMNLIPPVDLTACTTTVASFDLTTNSTIMTNGVDNGDYQFYYYNTYQEAVNFTGDYISNPTSYIGTNGEVIYVRVADFTSPCGVVKSFSLHVNSPLVLPSGDAEQTFTAGETLIDIELMGSAVDWYATAEGGESLPITTVLVNGVTYYAQLAESNNPCGIAERSPVIERFPVTVYDLAMGTPSWTNFNFKAVPNPVNDILNLSSAEIITDVTVYNLLGQEVMTKSINTAASQINVSGLSNGTYLMKVRGNNFIKTIKVIKQ